MVQALQGTLVYSCGTTTALSVQEVAPYNTTASPHLVVGQFGISKKKKEKKYVRIKTCGAAVVVCAPWVAEICLVGLVDEVSVKIDHSVSIKLVGKSLLKWD